MRLSSLPAGPPMTSADGLRQRRRARSTGTHVGVYDGEQAGMDTEGGRWQTVCEEHGHVISHTTLTTARSWAAAPEQWCETCMPDAEAEDTEGDDEHRVNIFRDGKVHVRAECCAHCLFSAERIVPGARARQILADTRATDGSSFICHRNQVSDEPEAICAAWYERFGADDPLLRLAEALGVIERVTITSEEPGSLPGRPEGTEKEASC